jgi:hypothetical protein
MKTKDEILKMNKKISFVKLKRFIYFEGFIRKVGSKVNPSFVIPLNKKLFKDENLKDGMKFIIRLNKKND